MTQTATVLLVAAACLFGVALFALSHRRDALGSVLAVLLGFDAVACALVGFAGLAGSRVEAAQLQAFAVVAELAGVAFAAAGIALASLLRRRARGRDRLEPALAGPQVPAQPEPDLAGEPEHPAIEADAALTAVPDAEPDSLVDREEGE
ncbi:MAG: hypothetical protein ACREOA_04575 [Candidatus Dormibacteria bacterium]